MTPEGAVVKAIMDLLAAERIPAIRVNTTTLRAPNGRPIASHSGGRGVADIFAWLWNGIAGEGRVLWIEAKAGKNKQSPEQETFQKWCEDNGMEYVVARSSDDVLQFLKDYRA